MKKYRRSLATLLVFLLVANILPMSAFAERIYDFPLRAADNKLIADENTRYVTLVKQDPQSKLITATVQIQHNSSGTEKLAIKTLGMGIYFNDKVAPYAYNPSQPAFDSGKLFPGGRLYPQSKEDNTEFLKYCKPLVKDYDVLGAQLIQRDANAKMIYTSISSSDLTYAPELLINPGQTLDIMEFYFMPANGTDLLDGDMFSYSYYFEAFPEVIRIAPVIANGVFFVEATGREVPLTNNYIVSPNTFKLHIRQPIPEVSPDNSGRLIAGFDPDTMEWSDSASGPFSSDPLTVGNDARTIYIRLKGDESYGGNDPMYGNYKKFLTGMSAQVTFEAAEIPTIPMPDASVVKTGVNKTAVDDKTRVGDVIEYTITASNNGTPESVWANTVLTDTISQFVTISVVPEGATYDPLTRVLTVNFGDIPGGQSKVVIFQVSVNANAYDEDITNGVTVSGKDSKESDAGDLNVTVKEDGGDRVVESEPVVVIPPARASLTKRGVNLDSADGKTRVGDRIEYTITATNIAEAASTWANAVLTDTISLYVTIDESSIAPEGVTYDPLTRVLSANLGDIPGGVSKVVTFRVSVNANAYDKDITNGVTVSGKDGKGNDAGDLNVTVNEEGDNRIVESEPVVEKNPAIAVLRKVGVNLTSNDGKTRVGDEIEYTISVGNGGREGSVWADAVLTDAIPLHVTFKTSSIPTGGNYVYDSENRILTVNLGDIAGGETKEVKFNVTVNEDAYGKDITNGVTVHGKDGKDDDAGGLSETVEEDGDRREVEGEVNYTVSFNVNGEIESSQVVKEGEKAIKPDADPYKEGYTFSGWRLDGVDGDLYDFDAPVNSDITLFASWTKNPKPPRYPSLMDIRKAGVNKTSTDGKTRVGDAIEYTIIVENIGDEESILANVELTDEININVTLVNGADGVTLPDGAYCDYNPESRELYVNLGDIEALEMKAVTFTVIVGENAYGEDITNGVTVSAKDGVDEEANDIEDEVEEDGDGRVVERKKTFTVSFNVDGAIVSSQVVTEGERAARPEADPSKAGYNFNGWRLGRVTGSLYDFDAPVNANITLYASWTIVLKTVFTVTFYAGDVVYQTAQVQEGNAVMKPILNPQKPENPDHYTFDKWRLGNGEGEAYDFATAVHSDLALYASWTYKGGGAGPVIDYDRPTVTTPTYTPPVVVPPPAPPAPVVTIEDIPTALSNIPSVPLKKYEEEEAPAGNLPKTRVSGGFEIGFSTFLYYIGALGASIFLLKKEEDSE